MSFSVNTNSGAYIALQVLNQTSRDLAETQNRINTGKNVSSAKDDSSIYAIAQNLRADVGGLKAAKASLDRAKSTLDVAATAGSSISDLLIQIRAKAVAASDAGLDAGSRASLIADYNSLNTQLNDVINTASFNGSNLLNANATGAVKAITNADASVYISVDGVDLLTHGAGNKLTFASTLATTASAATVQAEIANITASQSNLTSVLASLGSASRRVDSQNTFLTKLSDALETGIGNLVDADLARESAKLQSLQVKQQLGLQALSIANAAPQSILALFR
jgi:flagellin